jgi:hypothetical protein
MESKMLSDDEVRRLYRDFVESLDYLETAHASYLREVFVCHHNSYLVHRFLVRRGHAALQWVNGVYRASGRDNAVRHSWITYAVEGSAIIILELDPNQLHRFGMYPNDPMPAGPLNGPAVIIDAAVVEVADDLACTRWFIKSREVLDRYEPVPQFVPQLDFERLSNIEAIALKHFEDACAQSGD